MADQVQAAAVGQAHVGQAEIVFVRSQLRARGGDIGGGVHANAHPAQGHHQEFADVAFVVYDQGAAGVCHVLLEPGE